MFNKCGFVARIFVAVLRRPHEIISSQPEKQWRFFILISRRLSRKENIVIKPFPTPENRPVAFAGSKLLKEVARGF